MEAVQSTPTEAATAGRKVSPRASATYPYFDLNDSLDVARSIHEQAGGTCDPDQLAVYLNYKSPKSGTFQTRLSAAKQFGFVRSEGGSISVTERAMKILSPVLPEEATAARAEAFLAVDLFNKVFERYKGSTIPPRVGIKNLFSQTYGLAQDRLDPAVRVMFDSAEQAAMFPGGDQSRLVKPAARGTAVNPTAADHPQQRKDAPHHPGEAPRHSATSGGGSGDGPPGVHTAILGLLRELPPAGNAWPKKNKDRFVKAFLATLEFVYPDEDDEGGTSSAP